MRPGITTVLVVYKKSAWELHIAGRRRVDRRLGRVLKTAHQENARALATVKAALTDQGLTWRATARADLHPRGKSNHEADLTISVGGDGTFLEASHQVKRGAILGVNSSPAHSVGFFCAARRENFAEVLDRALHGRLAETRLHRLAVAIGGKPVPYLALNDVLVTHENPGATSRYEIVDPVKGIRETHRSSGLWVATAAGSTAGIRAAGGKRLPLESNQLQYAVRELYVAPGEKPFLLARGVLPRPKTLRIVCRMVGGALFIDGARHRYALNLGDPVTARISAHPLRVLGLASRLRAVV